MKRPSLILLSVCSVLLTCAALASAGWFRSAHVPSSRATDIYTSPAALRYRHSQPTHWRDCLLQR
jgi:hypothetical protein